MRSRKKSELADSSRTRKEQFTRSSSRKVVMSTTRNSHINALEELMKKEETCQSKMQKLRDSRSQVSDNENWDSVVH